ncbi:hypothetical protein DFQ29_001887 [Apophysomyces sp. BC1021]|nr:hypothetical protein DFQ29_001887 [Apophysomyces sp. BC1021]
MASTDEALQLLQELDHNALQSKYAVLQRSFQEVQQNAESMRIELNQTRQELDEKNAAISKLERSQKDSEETMANTSDKERRVFQTMESLRVDLLEQRAKNSEKSVELNELRRSNVKLISANQQTRTENIELQLQVKNFESRLSNASKREITTRQELLTLESESNVQREKYRLETRQITEQRTALQTERDSLAQENQDLQFNLSKCKHELDDATEKAKTYQERYEKLELHQMRMKKAHDTHIEVYERRQKDFEAQMEEYGAKLAETQTNAEKDKNQLEQANEALKSELSKCQDHLGVVRMQMKKLTGTDQSAESKQETSYSTLPALGSNLLQLIQQYESSGKQWETIYEEFFNLRANHIKAIAQNESSITTDLKQSTIRHALTLPKLKGGTKNTSFWMRKITRRHIKELNATVQELERKNEELTASLNDTTYQLRYLLRDVESREETIPPEVQSLADLMAYAEVSPTLDHDKVVFKNLSELQQRNSELLTEVRQLTNQIEKKTKEINLLSTQESEKDQSYETTMKIAQDTITDFNEKIALLESRLSTVNKECEWYKQLAEGQERPGKTVISDVLEARTKEYEQLLTENKMEAEAYRKETEEDIRQIQGQLEEAQTIANDARRQLVLSQAEIEQLRQKCTDYSLNADLRRSEATELNRRINALETQIAAQEHLIQETNDEILMHKSKEEALRNENIYISAELKANEEAYKRLISVNKDVSADRNRLTELLENINLHMSKSTDGSTELVEHLNSQVAQQARELEHSRAMVEMAERRVREIESVDQKAWQNKFLETRGELQQLKATHLEVEKQLASANQQQGTLETKLADALQRLQASPDGDADIAAADALLEQECEKYKRLLSNAEEEVRALEMKISEYHEKLEKERADYASQHEKHTQFVTQMRQTMDKVSNERETHEAQIKEVQGERNQAMLDIEKLTEEKRQLMSEKLGLVEEKEKLQEKEGITQAELTRLRQEIEQQVARVKEVEGKLETELAARTNDAEVISNLRAEVQKLQQELKASQLEAGGVQERLKAAELSWLKQKEQFEAVDTDMKISLQESQDHHEKLAEQLQTLVAKLEKYRTSSNAADAADADDTEINDASQKTIQQLRDIIASLRRDRDLWQARYTETGTRCEQAEADLEFVRRRLTATRTTLEALQDEAWQSITEKEKALVQFKNEAAVYKDNNTRLRQKIVELEAHTQKLENDITAKNAEIEPMTLQVKSLEAELKLSQEAAERLDVSQKKWMARTSQIMSKYNKIDPAEVERVKTELETASTELVETKSRLTLLETAKSESEEKLKSLETEYQKMCIRAKDRGRYIIELKKKYEEAESKAKSLENSDEKQTLIDEKKAVEEAKKAAEDAKEKADEERVKAEAALEKRMEEFTKLEAKALEELKQLKAEMEKNTSDAEELKLNITTLNTKVEELNVECGRYKAMHSMVSNKLNRLQKENDSLKQKAGVSEPEKTERPGPMAPKEVEQAKQKSEEQVPQAEELNKGTEESKQQPEVAKQPEESVEPEEAKSLQEPGELVELKEAEPAKQTDESGSSEQSKQTEPSKQLEPVGQAEKPEGSQKLEQPKEAEPQLETSEQSEKDSSKEGQADETQPIESMDQTETTEENADSRKRPHEDEPSPESPTKKVAL